MAGLISITHGIDDPEINLVPSSMWLLPPELYEKTPLSPFFFQSRGRPSLCCSERPGAWICTIEVSDQVVYHLPAGLTVEGAPQDNKIAWKARQLNHEIRRAPGQITIARILCAASPVKADDYQTSWFLPEVAAADRRNSSSPNRLRAERQPMISRNQFFPNQNWDGRVPTLAAFLFFADRVGIHSPQSARL